jgi:hypothetical protein
MLQKLLFLKFSGNDKLQHGEIRHGQLEGSPVCGTYPIAVRGSGQPKDVPGRNSGPIRY